MIFDLYDLPEDIDGLEYNVMNKMQKVFLPEKQQRNYLKSLIFFNILKKSFEVLIIK